MINKLTDIEKYYNLVNSKSSLVNGQFYSDSYFEKTASKLPMMVLLSDYKNDEELLLEALKNFKQYVEETDF